MVLDGKALGLFGEQGVESPHKQSERQLTNKPIIQAVLEDQGPLPRGKLSVMSGSLHEVRRLAP